MKAFYQSYLLRIWISRDGQYTRWQASLEDPHTRNIITFQEKQALINFLDELPCSDHPNEKGAEASDYCESQ